MTEILTPKETAEKLRTKEQTLASWRCHGRHDLPFIKVGRSVRYRLSDVEAWMKQRTGTSVAAINA